MGYAVYEEVRNRRWAGYGVPAPCDMPGCDAQIDRGLAYKCETVMVYEYRRDGTVIETPEVFTEDIEEVEVETEGCGLFFCGTHEDHRLHGDATPKPDSPEWEAHMLTDESWGSWREANPGAVETLRAHLAHGGEQR